jgi:hypothetical protein
VVFAEEQELRRHFVTEHGGDANMSRAQRRQVRAWCGGVLPTASHGRTAAQPPHNTHRTTPTPAAHATPTPTPTPTHTHTQALALNIQLNYNNTRDEHDAAAGAAAAAALARPGVVIGGGAGLQRSGGRGGRGGGMRHSHSEGAMQQALQASMDSSRAESGARAAAAAGPSSVSFSAEDFPTVSGQGSSGVAPLGTWLGASGAGPGEAVVVRQTLDGCMHAQESCVSALHILTPCVWCVRLKNAQAAAAR